MKFLVDNQLPLTLARWLRGRDYYAIHLLECDLAQADDAIVWERAKSEERILITKDEDFFILATRPHDHGKLLWLRMGNCRTSFLLQRLNKQWETITAAFSEGQQIVEVH